MPIHHPYVRPHPFFRTEQGQKNKKRKLQKNYKNRPTDHMGTPLRIIKEWAYINNYFREHQIQEEFFDHPLQAHEWYHATGNDEHAEMLARGIGMALGNHYLYWAPRDLLKIRTVLKEERDIRQELLDPDRRAFYYIPLPFDLDLIDVRPHTLTPEKFRKLVEVGRLTRRWWIN